MKPTDPPASPEAFLEGSGLGIAVFERVRDLVPDAEVRVTRSQIAFRQRRAFAWLWRPRRWLGRRAAEIVLSVGLPRWDASPRWKEVAQPTPRLWMHHLELSSVDEVDDEVAGWLREAAEQAANAA